MILGKWNPSILTQIPVNVSISPKHPQIWKPFCKKLTRTISSFAPYIPHRRFKERHLGLFQKLPVMVLASKHYQLYRSTTKVLVHISLKLHLHVNVHKYYRNVVSCFCSYFFRPCSIMKTSMMYHDYHYTILFQHSWLRWQVSTYH